jgi:putative transposase
MSVTRQEPVPAGMVPAHNPAGVLGEVSHYDRENPSSAGAAAVPLRELMDDRLLDALLERSKDEAGGLRLTGAGSMLGELVKAVLERALEAGLTAHLGYERHDPAGPQFRQLPQRRDRQEGADRDRAGGPGRAA